MNGTIFQEEAPKNPSTGDISEIAVNLQKMKDAAMAS